MDFRSALRSFVVQRIAEAHEAYHLGMSRIHPECPESGSSELSVAADVLLRQHSDEEEDEEEDKGRDKEGNDDGEPDDYSDWAWNMPRFRIGKRLSKRTKSVVPVRLWIAGSEDSHLAHTLDVSNHGVKLGGCRGEMKVGDKIEIQYRQKRAQFRVAWITARTDSLEKQIGAECLEPGK